MIVVDQHHHVLEAWASFRATLQKAPRLLTLDHHTDTSLPFRNFLHKEYKEDKYKILVAREELLRSIDFRDLKTVQKAIALLSHDEHIVTAIQSDIISSAFVVAQNAYDTDTQIYQQHKIMCYGVDRKLQSTGLIISDLDVVLESHFLSQALTYFNYILETINESNLVLEPYILDIDLDYLNTIKSVQPSDAKMIKELASGAGLITVATESNHVHMCAVDKILTSEYLLERVERLVQ